MEIKVFCDCGQKYAFDANPVQGRMSFTVTCPVCGADGTQRANEIIQQSATPAAPVGASLPESAPPSPAPALAPGGLRINRHAPANPATTSASVPPSAPVPPQHRAAPVKPPKSGNKLVGVLSTVFVLAVIGFGVWKFASKWYKRIATVVDVAKAVSEPDSQSNWNFDYQDSVVLFVQHTNHAAVAEACKEFWRVKLKRNLTMTPATSNDGVGSKEYEVMSSYNGWVRIMSTLDWRASEFEALSQHLSQQFNTLVFETSDVDFSGAYHFGVYESGVRKFHAKMEIKMKNGEPDEIVTTEGNDWAIAHGFKPGADGFKEFSLADGDKIAQGTGMKLWDEPENRKPQTLLLKESPN